MNYKIDKSILNKYDKLYRFTLLFGIAFIIYAAAGATGILNRCPMWVQLTFSIVVLLLGIVMLVMNKKAQTLRINFEQLYSDCDSCITRGKISGIGIEETKE